MKFKALHFAFLFVLLLNACQQSGSKASQPSSTEQGAPTAGKETLAWAGDQDPVCEMKIDQTAEDTVHYGGKIYGFCGPDCKAKFQETPAKYAGK